MSQQQIEYLIGRMEEIFTIFMRDVYYDLNPTAEQQDDENWWSNIFLQKAVNSDEYNFQKTWEELRDDTSPYDAFLIIEMINKINKWSEDEFGETWTYESPLTYNKIYKMYAYMYAMQCGVEHWKFQSGFWNHDIDNASNTESAEEEYTGTKDFPSNETDDNCHICLDAYSSQKLRFEGVRNDEYKEKCHHYCDFCCCDCWLEMSAKKIGEKDRCPICKAENANPLFKS
jgi:hypothetical protein